MPKNNNQQQSVSAFQGFQSPNFTPVPDELFDELLTQVSGAELKVLLYIMRRTFGFKKSSDDISLNQICRGIIKKDGEVLDKGTGLSQSTVQLAVKGLIEKNIILETKRMSAERGNEATTYSLNLIPFTENRQGASPKIGEALHRFSVTQDTVEQETVKQEIYPSNIRKAENEETDYVNQRTADNEDVPTPPTSEKTEQRKRGRPPQPQRARGEEQQRPSKNRNVEAPQQEASPQDREIFHKSGTGRTATSNLQHIGDVLQLQQLPHAVPADEAYEAIRDYIRDMAGKHHDEASLKSSTTRAYNLYLKSGVSLSAFINVFYDADKEAGRRSGSIKKRTADGFTNRMPYIFAYMEDKLGLRDKPR